MKNSFVISVIIVVSGVACKKDISNPVSYQPPSTFSQVFEEFWNGLNVNYVWWDIDSTNWDAVHDRYKPLFSALQLGNDADLQKSVGYFREMIRGLTDHHFSIAFTNTALRDSSVDPARDRLLSDPAFRTPYSYILTDERYLDTGYLFGIDPATDPSNPLLALSGTIHDSILLFSCNQFSLSSSFQSDGVNGVQPVLRSFFGRLHNPSGLKAILLDFRDNPGGSVSDLNFLAGQFIGRPLHFGYSRYKSGNGRLDYMPWIDADLLPQSGAAAVTLPIIILADRYSASIAEIITMALRVLPQCRVVGETTFGATGPFAAGALYNDGPFEVPGFLSVTTSSAEFKYIDGKIYEGKGFPPDYAVPFSAAALGAGDDPQMDKALSLLEK